MKLRSAFRFIGRLLVILGGAQALPLLCCLLYGEKQSALAFTVSALVASVCGLAFAVYGQRPDELYRREGILIVALGWILASLFGALPYLLSGTMTDPLDALFESASGFTTTGATVLTEIESVDRGVLFWRSFTQWMGGMGIIVLFVALLPELGPGARFLYRLEVPGPTAEALKPRIHDTATLLWKIYLLLTVAETLLLILAGLDLFDALTHTFSTLSTGGFSPHNESIAAFDSPLVELIVIVFMILAGANFSLYYGLRHRQGWNLLRDFEFRLYVGLLVAASAFVAWDLLQSGLYSQYFEACLDALFHVASIMTTTGFVSEASPERNFEHWPHFSRMLLIVLMFVGGCAGSTAGSMKVMRMAIGVKSALREVRLIFSPSAVVSIVIGGKVVPNQVVRSVAGFFILYLSIWGVGALLLSSGGASLVTSASASIATLGNIGPGLDAVGPVDNYAHFNGWHKALMVLLMWLGRLEVYSIAALFMYRFWRR